MDLILRVTEGPDAGKRVTLTAGRHLLGKSKQAALTFSDPAVSWEHAIITVDDGKISLTNLSANGTEVRGRQAPNSGTTALHPRDTIRLTQATTAVVESASGASKARLVLVLVVLLLIGAVGGVLMAPNDTKPRTSIDETRVYLHLEHWAQQQADRGALPADAPVLLRNGWRMERRADHEQSAQAWHDLMIILKQAADRPPFDAANAEPEKYESALKNLATQQATGDEDDATNAAAFTQFVKSSYNWNKTQAKEQDN